MPSHKQKRLRDPNQLADEAKANGTNEKEESVENPAEVNTTPDIIAYKSGATADERKKSHD